MLKSIYKFLSPRFQTLFLDYKVDLKPRKGNGPKGSNAHLYALIDKNRAVYAGNLRNCLKDMDVFLSIKETKEENNEHLPTWNNGFLPGLDIVVLYSLLKKFNPKKYIEIGSGNSTKVARKAIMDGGLKTKITSIDPYPRASIDKISDDVIRRPVEDCDLSIFDTLQENDIVFIDNSHRSLPNSDVTVCFLEILPKLKPGVIVHIHDIYIPYDYPQFMCDRFYSEQYLLASYLLGGNEEKMEIIMPNFFISEDEELSVILNPLWEKPQLKNVERHGGSFWFVVK